MNQQESNMLYAAHNPEQPRFVAPAVPGAQPPATYDNSHNLVDEREDEPVIRGGWAAAIFLLAAFGFGRMVMDLIGLWQRHGWRIL